MNKKLRKTPILLETLELPNGDWRRFWSVPGTKGWYTFSADGNGAIVSMRCTCPYGVSGGECYHKRIMRASIQKHLE